MKLLLNLTSKFLFLVSLGCCLLSSQQIEAQTGVLIKGTSGTVDPSAMLEVNSTSLGLLIPRMTATQRDAIASPATGLVIYNTDTNQFNYYSSGWIAIPTSASGTTGTGAVVLANSPTLVTPNLGTPSALVGTNITGTAAGLSIGGNAATVTTNANLTGAVTSSGNATSLGSFSSANLSGALTDETGTGAAVFATSPTLVTPNLGTPSTLVGTNITGTAAGLSIGGNAATATTATNLVGSGSTSNAVDLATAEVSGTLPVANGGTGVSTTTAYGVIAGGTTTTGAFQNVGAGTSGQVLTSTGSGSLPTWQTSGGLLNVRTITSGTTYTPTTGTKAILIQMVGGGGAGGGSSTNNTAKLASVGGGGGAGGYLQKYITGIGTGPFTISIGTGGAASSGAAGGNGTATTFNDGTTTYTASFGIGGSYLGGTSTADKDVIQGGAGGSSTNGDINAKGAPGGWAENRSNGEYSASGSGGSGPFGGGGNAIANSYTGSLIKTTGNDGTGFGAGGSGSIIVTGSGAPGSIQTASGGAGSAGVIVVYEYK